MNIHVYSMSDLIKKSASQIMYLMLNPPGKGVSQQKLDGVEHQKRMTTEGSYQEMRGSYAIKGITIYFCWDEVVDEGGTLKFHEMKKPGKEQWYYDCSLLQTAVYAAATDMCYTMETATFHTRETGIRQTLDISLKKKRYYLVFGHKLAEVKVVNRLGLLGYYADKACLIRAAVKANDWDMVKEFDKVYKHNEVGLLGDYYKEVK